MPKVSSKSRGAKKTITDGLYLFGPGFSLFMLSQCPARVSLFVFCAPHFYRQCNLWCVCFQLPIL